MEGPLRLPRRAAVGLAIALVGVLATACLGGLAPPPLRRGMVRERTVTIRVEGTPGLPFEGSYGTPTATRPVQGRVPAAYTVTTAVAVTAAFTKANAEGELVVRLLLDGHEVARRATRHPYGTVTLLYQVMR
ncbi:MAG: hypothetical protein QN122_01640 [Armatimonadota bacterium]|nr:hypothetical protein [Armatimonadota bacterium]MDR7448362.1 hypothetical protein [Armatimonadota bacterium]MDR7459763.1 hypothetical protein [Armatimonadota bacterium]MDR7479274.1 hypothetical protein [Armatimonadota bacterium]MDR7489051.1 hypothetical protein [Armatimonadota bacterium]